MSAQTPTFKFFSKDLDKLTKDPKFVEMFQKAPLFTATGAYLGFPISDIEYFNDRMEGRVEMSSAENARFERHPLCGTGYVPDPKHWDLLTSREQVADMIQPHRHATQRFPVAFETDADCDAQYEFLVKVAFKVYKDPYSVLIKEFTSKNKNWSYHESCVDNLNKCFPERSKEDDLKLNAMPSTKLGIDRIFSSVFGSNLFTTRKQKPAKKLASSKTNRLSV